MCTGPDYSQWVLQQLERHSKRGHVELVINLQGIFAVDNGILAVTMWRDFLPALTLDCPPPSAGIPEQRSICSES